MMLKERVQAYCNTEGNCSHIILKAAAEEYGFPLSEETLASCNGIQGGFGTGSICSALIAAIMVLGLMFDEEEVKAMRLIFLSSVQQKFGFLDCSRLSAMGEDCGGVLYDIAEILQELIEK